MAIVYRARYTAVPGITKPVVIKKVLDVYAEDSAFVEQFIQEARICVGLNHGNIVQVFDFGQVNGEYFLAMELVEGQPLSKVLKRAQAAGLAKLPAPLAVSIAIEMCKGLHHAHTRTDEKGRPLGLVHRDVSPDNVLISYEGEVKISDFGVAKAQLAGRPETEAGMVKGKYLYFSPEQARGEALDARSDVYAVGVVLFRMLCGRLPVEGPEVAVMQRIVQGKLTPALQLNPELDSDLLEILDEALANRRQDRVPSAEVLQQKLAHWLITRASLFASHTVKHMMGLLYEKELKALGRAPQVSARFREQMARWGASVRGSQQERMPVGRRPTLEAPLGNPAPPSVVTAEDAEPSVVTAQDAEPAVETSPGTEPAVETSPGTAPSVVTAQDAEPVPTTNTQVTATVVDRRALLPRGRRRTFWLVGGIAVVVLAGLAAAWLLRTPPLEVSSEPPGAQVIMDGAAVGVTPLKLGGIARGAPHTVEMNLRGMRTWSHAFEPGTLATRLEVALEPVPPPAPSPSKEAPRPDPVAEESFASRLGTEELPTHFTLQEKWHSFSTTARSLQESLDVKRGYTVWTSGTYTGDVPISEQDLRQGLSPASTRSGQVYVFLEGAGVPSGERLFMASSKPHTFAKAQMLHAFVLVGITSERNTDKNLTLHVRDNVSKKVVSLHVEARRFAHQMALENRFSVRKLNPEDWYALDIHPHEGAPPSTVAVLVVPKTAGRVQMSGQAAGEVRYALAPGHYVLQGARELWFALPRSEQDGEAQMEVSLEKTSPPPPEPPVQEVSPGEVEEGEGTVEGDEGAVQ
ncbi:MAG: serine/threonine protein kinase [Hyalangium sp.]